MQSTKRPAKKFSTRAILETIHDDVKLVKKDVSELKTDVSKLKTDVSELKKDVAELKTDVSVLKADMQTVKTNLDDVVENTVFLKDNMFTQGEAKEMEARITKNFSVELKKTTYEILDHVDKKNTEYRGELNLKIQKEDDRLDATINILRDKKVLNDHDHLRLSRLSPFAPAP